jgi:uncharacterized protein YigE (DUF2233 family)
MDRRGETGRLGRGVPHIGRPGDGVGIFGRPAGLAFALAAFALLAAPAPAAAESTAERTIPWQALEAGLDLAEIVSPVKSTVGDSRITVLRIDPRRYALRLLSVTEQGGRSLTAKAWAGAHGLIAAVNAGMYQKDGRTSVGFMRNFGHVNNGYINRNQAVLAFNRKDDSVPAAQIIDRSCQDFKALRAKYHSFVQSIRMVSCDQKNVWNKQARGWSMATMATDMEGRVLFIITRSPYTVHDFINILMSLPLGIRNAMYLEGGPKASLYIAAGGTEIERIGRFESIFLESDTTAPAQPLPNVIGVVRKNAE